MKVIKWMFTLLLFAAVSALFSANKPNMENDYSALWKQADSLADLRQPRAALEVVNKIYQQAGRDKNTPQVIRARLYQIKLSSEFEMDFMVKAINDLRIETDTAETPERQLLHSMLAQLYFDYFQQNRYKILNRSATIGFDNEDVETWDVHKLMEKASRHYQLSLENPEELQQLNIEQFRPILEKHKGSEVYRPTLFDFLTWRAIEFYENDISTPGPATMQFIPKSEKYFEPAGKFVKIDFQEKYSASGTVQALILLQKVMAFHLNDKNPKALVDADLKRLDMIHQKSVLPDKDDLYLKALQKLRTDYEQSDVSAEVAFQMARFHNTRATRYSPLTSDEFRWENQKAEAICEEAIQAFPESDGAHNCRLLLNKITEKELNIKLENAVVPGKPSLGLLSWKNNSEVHFRLIKTNYQEFSEMNRQSRRPEIANTLAGKPFVDTWSVSLPDEKDYQTHDAEFRIPEADEGFYVLLAASDETFEGGDVNLAWAEFWSTGLSCINQRLQEGGYDIFVLDRESGNPKAGVEVSLYKRDYDYRKRKYETKFILSKETDSNGNIKLEADGDLRGGLYVELSDGDDVYIPEWNFYLTEPRDQPEKTSEKTFFFTDRAIYRPGQLVYFKAILLEKTGDQYEIKPDASTTVEFYDANNQKVSTLDLTSNEFGSVNGAFTIPTGLLNGGMRIKNQSGNTSIQVEEYKRPAFEVTFEPVKGSYKLDEEVTVTGTAKAYAGNSIGQATVNYRIVRNAFNPWPYRWGHIYPPQQPVEIASGQTETDTDGNFAITFKAIPGNPSGGNVKQSYSFVVNADVTDINGETQTGNTAVNVGAEALMLNTDIPENINQEEPENYKIIAENLNGEKLDTEVDIRIYALEEPGRLIKDRYWSRPDVFLMDEDDFLDEFPKRVYKHENDPLNWEKGEVVLEMKINTALDSILPGKLFQQWDRGVYLIEMEALDAFGKAVQTGKNFTLFDPDAKRPPVETYHWFQALKSKGEPGGSAQMLLGSSVRNVSVLYEVQYKGETIDRQWIEISNDQKIIDIPIGENHRGNLTFHYNFIIDNRAFSGSQIITVPYTDKKLDLAFETLRTDLEPGGREKWAVTIRDKNGERVAAEMLASMYDASLDEYIGHGWMFDLYRIYNQINGWQAGREFSVVNGKFYTYKTDKPSNYIYRSYDRLNWFGLNTWGSYLGRDRAVGGKAVETMDRTMVQNEVFTETGIPDNPEEAGMDEQVPPPPPLDNDPSEAEGMQLRRDFSETAFYYPELRTNDSGNVVIEFTLPESFTRWKFMGLSHTKDLMTGMLNQEFTASKDLMIVPNTPRFFREGDTLVFSAKVTNLSDEDLDGSAELQFFDALTMKEVTDDIIMGNPSARFAAEQGRSQPMTWKLAIPHDYSVLTYRVKATTRNFTDGEERSVPVLPNRMLVTEAMPMPVRGNETRDFTFERLVESGDSETLQNYRLTLEFASNPAWYAVQALPVISETKYNNAVSVFSSFFASSIAFHITNQNPGIKRVFDSWKNETPESFLSKLEKNQDLKQVLLEQTPWVINAQNEQERKQRIAMLFDLNNMQNRLDNSIRQLEKFQKPGGGFCWMNEMRESRYVTQLVLQGMGKLHHMGVLDAIGDDRISRMMNSAVRYLDREIFEDFEKLEKRFPDKLEEDHLSNTHIQYLYARSFFNHIMLNPSYENAVNYFKHQASEFWKDKSLYLQGMIATALHRNGIKQEAVDLIVASLRDRALHDEETGMFWRGDRGYFWYESPIETQAMMIEVFDEVASDLEAVEEMKVWLLKQKQTQDWETSRATADAVYALLSRGSDLLSNDELVEVSVSGDKIETGEMGTIEAGTGYFQVTWDEDEIEPEMGEVKVEKPGDGIAWGAMYWQYFEDLDRITQHETGLSVKKELFVQRNTDEGRKAALVSDGDKLQVGNRLTVRIEIRVDRNMEFVHLRDMRASAFEPLKGLSGYAYQGGLGYYQTTKDASTDFFFDYLPRGTYVFEYPLIVSQSGDFSNGITTLQCMYAPEFVSHSKGVRVIVEE